MGIESRNYHVNPIDIGAFLGSETEELDQLAVHIERPGLTYKNLPFQSSGRKMPKLKCV